MRTTDDAGATARDLAALLEYAATADIANDPLVVDLVAAIDRLARENALLRQDAPETATLGTTPLKAGDAWLRVTPLLDDFMPVRGHIVVTIKHRPAAYEARVNAVNVRVPLEDVTSSPSTEAATLRAENARLAAQVEAVRALPESWREMAREERTALGDYHIAAVIEDRASALDAALATEPAAARTLPASVKAMREEA